MKDFMIQLVNASFQGGVIIAVVLALRLLLQKAPKSTLCLLWLLAIIRLLLPFQLESQLSLQPDIEILTQQKNQQPDIIIQMPSLPAHAAPTTTIKTDDGQLLHVELTYSNEVIEPDHSVTIDWVGLLPWLWLAVATGLLGWSLLSYLKLHRKTKNAVILHDGVWLSPNLDTAFVLGFLKPQIYLPAKLTAEEQKLVIAHERTHIARIDHWYKLLSFITLCIHWFNPLVWLSYVLLCRDIEMACDEQVVKAMDTQQRKAYSAALLGCSANSRNITAYPVAFAEVSVKERIVSVLKYKKPGFWISLVSIVAIVFMAICFLTSPMDDATRMTKMCREAVERIQNADSYYLTEEQYTTRVYGEDFLGLMYDTADSLRSGNDWLRVTVSPDFTNCYLQKDGQQYIKYISDAVAPGELGYPDWTSVDLSQIQTFRLSWLEELDWDQHEIVYMDHGTNPAAQFFVSFKMDEDPSDENLTLTSLEFHFDDDSQLVSVSKITTSTLGVTSSTVTVEAINDSGIANSIEACFQPHVDLEQELEALCLLYNDRKSETMDLWRKKCINLMKELRSSEYQHILCSSDHIEGRMTIVEQIQMPGFHYLSQSAPEIDTPLGYYQTAAIMAMDGDECYTLTVLNPGDGAWVLTPLDETPATSWMPKYLYEELSAFETYPLEVYEFETGIRCVFTNQKAANGNNTMEFRFDPDGKLTSIVETFTHFEGDALVSDYDILWETDAHIQQLADDLLEEARKHAAYQQQLDELEVSLEEKSISAAIAQHFEFRKRILLDGISEISEMDPALLSDELRHKKLVDADSLKRVDSEYLITEIILQDDGSADILVTETVYYEIDDDTLEDNTLDEIIVHMIRLADVDGNCRVIEDAYRERYTNFNSRTFNAYPLEQAQKRIVTNAVEKYFAFKKEILCNGVTVIPQMHPLRLKDKLAHKQALDDAGIQWIDSSYVIEEIDLWDREYADVTLTETVTYTVNGEAKQEIIAHNIGVVGVQTHAYVIDDGYFEPFSGFRSASYVDPSELP